MAEANPGPDFFISHATADRAWAEWIAVELEKAGYSTILQSFDFRPGTDFVHHMHRATTTAQRTIAVLSPDYLTSQFSEAEWRTAFAKDPDGEKGLLIPVRVQPGDPTGLLATRVYVDLVGATEAEARRTLLAAVDRNRPRPTTARFPGHSQPASDGEDAPSARFPGPGPAVSNPSAVSAAGVVWLQFDRRLGRDWTELATVLDIPAYVQARFPRGEEAREIRHWLEARDDLGSLPGALRQIGRVDLAPEVEIATGDRPVPPSRTRGFTGPASHDIGGRRPGEERRTDQREDHAASVEVVFRRVRRFNWAGRSIVVIVDGREIGRLANGESLTTRLPPGRHRVCIRLPLYGGSPEVEFDVPPDVTTLLEIRPLSMRDIRAYSLNGGWTIERPTP